METKEEIYRERVTIAKERKINRIATETERIRVSLSEIQKKK